VETHRVNQTGTVAILNAARRNGRAPVPVVYASSAAIYGDTGGKPMSEDLPAAPLTPYGADKRGCELHAAVAWTVHRVPTTGLRVFNAYGPRQDGSSPYAGVISLFAERLKAGLPLTVYGDGTQVRDFIYVTDVVAGFEAAMAACRAGARIHNICTGVPTSIDRLIRELAAQAATAPKIDYAPKRPGDLYHSVGNAENTAKALGFRARTPLAEGLSALLDATA
ncbi:MAG: NAD-dependent epimerase/dehydratase family protein, partial [Stellaceae bacterium]